MPWLAPLSPDLVWFRGDDAVKFLNDLLSQEIGDMADGEVRRSMLLTPDGKVQHLLWVVMSQGSVGLITEPGRGEALIADLGRYKIRVAVEIEPESGPVWLVVGEWAGIDVSWDNTPRFIVVGEKPGLEERSLDEYERLRIDAGEPIYGTDVTDETIPQETGLVPLTVDFTKGCFLGQELVGRIDARSGNVPRPLRRLELAGEAAAAGDTLLYDGGEVGRLTSVSGTIGLAVVKRKVAPGESVDVGETTAIVVEIPPKTQT